MRLWKDRLSHQSSLLLPVSMASNWDNALLHRASESVVVSGACIIATTFIDKGLSATNMMSMCILSQK